jgi:hypothetical protein
VLVVEVVAYLVVLLICSDVVVKQQELQEK